MGTLPNARSRYLPTGISPEKRRSSWDFNAAPFLILEFKIFKEGPEMTTNLHPNETGRYDNKGFHSELAFQHDIQHDDIHHSKPPKTETKCAYK
jgi:hypothetical protein